MALKVQTQVYEIKGKKFRRWGWVFVKDGILISTYVDFEDLSGYPVGVD